MFNYHSVQVTQHFILDSDDEKSFRKDLLGKKKDKKESKKDKGYMAFEGESSGDEDDARLVQLICL